MDVRTWTQIVKRYAKGGDNRAKGMLSALAFTLYYSLGRDQRNIVDNAIRCNLLQLDLDDDTEIQSLTATAETQFRLVDDILRLIAKDSPTDGIRRLFKASKSIHQYVRVKAEKPHVFARKFQGKAKQYLNMCNASQSVHESQNFAVLLLENAKLPSATFNNIVTQLVTKSLNKNDTISNSTVDVPISVFLDLSEKIVLMRDAMSKWETTLGISANTREIQELIEQSKMLTMTVDTACKDASKSWTKVQEDNRVTYSVALDDAVEALCDIKADEDTASQKFPVFDHKMHGDANIAKRGVMMTKRKETDFSVREPNRKKPYILPGTGRKKDSICVACKIKGHWKGDFECEKHPMHQQWLERMSAKKDTEREKHISNDATPPYFR